MADKIQKRISQWLGNIPGLLSGNMRGEPFPTLNNMVANAKLMNGLIYRAELLFSGGTNAPSLVAGTEFNPLGATVTYLRQATGGAINGVAYEVRLTGISPSLGGAKCECIARLGDCSGMFSEADTMRVFSGGQSVATTTVSGIFSGQDANAEAASTDFPDDLQVVVEIRLLGIT